MDLKVNIFKDGRHWKTKKFDDPRTKFVRDFNSVNGQNSAVIARENIEKVQKSLWMSRYVLLPSVAAIAFSLATFASVNRNFSGPMQEPASPAGISFFATTPDLDDPNKGDALTIVGSHCAAGEVAVTKDNGIVLPQSACPYIISWNGGFDQDFGPDQTVELGFRAVDANGLKVDPVLFNDAEARYRNSSYEYQRPSARAIFEAGDGPLTVTLEILHGAKDLDISEGWIEISQSSNRPSGKPLASQEPGS